MSKFSGNDNYGKPKSEYIEKLKNMDEKKLLETTEQMIWLSAYAANNPRSDYHWQCDACYDECGRRDRIDIYKKAWRQASGN